jgi:hypothetical protein
MMTRIERTLLKYDPLDISMPKKTMFQANPLDFPNVKNAEIYIVDIELALPASAWILIPTLADALGLPKAFVVVRSLNEPAETETARLTAEAEATEKGLKPEAVLMDPTYEDAPETPSSDTLYGDAYNKKFLAYLKRVEDERNEASKVDAPAPLFKWLDKPKDATLAGDFNADVDGAPAPANVGSDAPPSIAGKHGNVENKDVSFRRAYRDESGKKVVITRSKKG